MTPDLLTIRKSLNKAFLKVKPSRSQIELFKSNLQNLYTQISEKESEEHHKNIISEFLKNTYYQPNHYINTKDRTDLVIHNGKDAKSTVGVIIETKRPGNKAEMPSKDNLNTKAVHEIVLYYLRERINQKNLEIKYLIATDLYEWFIFNAQDFEKIFAKNKKLVEDFEKFQEGRLSGTKTEFFYKDIAKPFIENLDACIPVTHFDIRDFETIIKSEKKEEDNKLIGIYKIFSAEHLLKLPFSNDSNTLDKKFYNELLHIIGLEERKEGSKKLIGRKVEGKRDNGSLIENAINILRYEDCLNQLGKPSDYGTDKEEQLFHVALELSITWINRILFMKLLEGQLIKYHKGDGSFKFLNPEKIPNYDTLNKLFFHVLAIKESERGGHVKDKFKSIPYLNSSLFEPNELEHKTIRISNLEDDFTVPILSSTVLKDSTGKKLSGKLSPLSYLLDFLDAYDFSSEGSEDISEENKTLINASVLGLIFEKINGYKDGSFFTPGFITMYMARETIRRSVVQKFNEAYKWNCETLDDLYNKIEDKKEANEIINSIKIVDPAVGSGHFLVSALNEIIAIKSELKVLSDEKGKVLRDYHIEVINDELVITDEDGEFFEYHPKNPESQRIQETLFREKQTIIENCLFGVDINQNSVKICRLRLWIELLKNTYYKPQSGHTELETLPNIDINIKCGNSLISRYPLDADIKKALSKSKWTIDSYRLAVMSYRNAENKDQKASMRKLIDEIKSDFESEVSKGDKRFIKLNKLKGDLEDLTGQQSLFELAKKEKTEWNKKVKRTTDEFSKLESELKEIKSNKIYENAFEWRFEFPEVLNDEGDFVGFDVVIGNPPYLRVRDELEQIRNYYFDNFKVSENQLDLYHLFIERSFEISNKQSTHSLIVPNAFLANQNNARLRQFILNNFSIDRIIEIKDDVFEEASVEVMIFIFGKPIVQSLSQYYVAQKGNFYFKNNFDSNGFHHTPNNNFTVTVDTKRQEIITKIINKSVKVSDLFDTISGIKEYQVGKGKPQQNAEQVKGKVFNANTQINDTYLPELRGKNLSKYSFTWKNEYISYGIWLAEPRVSAFFEGDKILIRQIPAKNSLIASYIKETFVVDQTAYITKPKTELNILFYLGILNSTLLFWYFQNINNEFDQLFPKIKVKEFNALPLPKIQFSNNVISDIVSKILNLKSNGKNIDTSTYEMEIDKLVYKLYDLTEEEIKIIEESINN